MMSGHYSRDILGIASVFALEREEVLVHGRVLKSGKGAFCHNLQGLFALN